MPATLRASGRFSFMGDSSGPLGAVVSYDVAAREVRVERRGEVETFDESVFDYLGRELRRPFELYRALRRANTPARRVASAPARQLSRPDGRWGYRRLSSTFAQCLSIPV